MTDPAGPLLVMSSRLLWRDSLSAAAQTAWHLGFHGLEIWCEHAWRVRSLRALRRTFRHTSLTYYLHAPFYDLNICATNPRARRFSIEETLRGLRLAASLGIRQVVVHPGHASSSKGPPEESWALLLDGLDRIAAAAHRWNLVLAVENMEDRPKELLVRPEELSKLLMDLRRDEVGFCLDLAHAWTAGEETPELLIQRFDRRIIHVHFSNVDGKRIHLPLDQGRSPTTPRVEAFLRAFPGPLTLEGAAEDGRQAATVGIARLKATLAEEVVE
jgi:sugar phosphate isomerase/epimerase